MVRADVLTLIADQQPRGAFETPVETTRKVFCNVRSVGMSEMYRALSEGLHPELIFDLSDRAEYKGEKVCLYSGLRYRIIRVYETAQRVELTVERMTGYVEPVSSQNCT